MSDPEIAVSVDELTRKIEYLQELFVRKLLDDKSKNQLVQAVEADLKSRDERERGIVFEGLFKECLITLDRLRSNEPSTALVESVIDEFLTVFERRGLTQLPNTGIFDPRLHEIIETVEASDDQQDGQILHVERDGYALGDRLLRPARVVVAKTSSEDH